MRTFQCVGHAFEGNYSAAESSLQRAVWTAIQTGRAHMHEYASQHDLSLSITIQQQVRCHRDRVLHCSVMIAESILCVLPREKLNYGQTIRRQIIPTERATSQAQSAQQHLRTPEQISTKYRRPSCIRYQVPVWRLECCDLRTTVRSSRSHLRNVPAREHARAHAKYAVYWIRQQLAYPALIYCMYQLCLPQLFMLRRYRAKYLCLVTRMPRAWTLGVEHRANTYGPHT